jgi:hypothetical protein
MRRAPNRLYLLASLFIASTSSCTSADDATAGQENSAGGAGGGAGSVTARHSGSEGAGSGGRTGTGGSIGSGGSVRSSTGGLSGTSGGNPGSAGIDGGLSGTSGGNPGSAGIGSGGAGSGGISGGTRGSGTGGSAVLYALPVPPTSNVAQPSASVTGPSLKVLPWAGFRAAITYTFDDSQPSQFQHWPELAATGVPMTFFVNASANWQTNYDANWKAINDAGCELGNHTWSHCQADFSGCTPKYSTQAEEIDQNTAYIVSHLGAKAVTSFAAPFGNTGWNTSAASRFLLDRGVVSGTILSSGAQDWYNLPVFPVAAGQTATDFNSGIDSARTQGSWTIYMFHSILPTTDNWFAGVDIAGITASVAHAKSFGDVWFDNITPIAAYLHGAEIFAKLNTSATSWTWTLPTPFPPGQVLRVTVAGGKLSQNGTSLNWDPHGYYELSLDAKSLTWTP